jgi:hypothetical protein
MDQLDAAAVAFEELDELDVDELDVVLDVLVDEPLPDLSDELDLSDEPDDSDELEPVEEFLPDSRLSVR